MLNSRPLDELAARIGQVFENSPAKDIEKNIKTLLTNGLARLDVVPRAEFDVQAQVLLRTREKLEALERRLAELEARMGAPGQMQQQGPYMGGGPGMGGMQGPGPMQGGPMQSGPAQGGPMQGGPMQGGPIGGAMGPGPVGGGSRFGGPE